MNNSQKPIGIFDSGIGGLTVAKEIVKVLPNENIIYIGDTARVPYGIRGKNVITRFAKELAKFLIEQDIKYLVIACNTITANCLSEIKRISPVSVLGVIEPTIKYLSSVSRNKKIGVIGTPSTISSNVYETHILRVLPNSKVISQACPLFVPLVEEGLINHPATDILAQEYLSVFKKDSIDSLILGCTHYPLLSNTISKVLDKNILIVDSAKPIAHELKKKLTELNLLNTSSEVKRMFYFTDVTEKEHSMMDVLFGSHVPYEVLPASFD